MVLAFVLRNKWGIMNKELKEMFELIFTEGYEKGKTDALDKKIAKIEEEVNG